MNTGAVGVALALALAELALELVLELALALALEEELEEELGLARVTVWAQWLHSHKSVSGSASKHLS